MNTTPYFPSLRPKLAAMGQRSCTTLQNTTLPILQQALGHLIPVHLLSDEDEGVNSRKRIFFLRRTFWCFLWQILGAQRACRDVVLQVQALCSLASEGKVSSNTGAYVSARYRLPLERLLAIFSHLASTAAGQAGTLPGSQGRRILAVDATVIQLPDTPDHQKRYPQPPLQKPGCGFPIMKISALFNLASGAIEIIERGNRLIHELPLFFRLFSHLRPGDIWVGDALYSAYNLLAYSRQQGIDTLSRIERPRRVDFRKGKVLGPLERLITWTKKTDQPHYLSEQIWASIPATLTLRLVRIQLRRPGFRPLSFHVVTTLLDSHTYPADWIADLYLRRWRLELCFRDLKTSLGMEALRTQSPAMAEKEVMMFLIAHNLIRCLIAETARRQNRLVESFSFMGTVAVTRQYCQALALTRTRRQRKRLLLALSDAIAQQMLPARPNRSEPRALKRRGKGFPRLMISRNMFRARKAKQRLSPSVAKYVRP